MGRGCLLWTAKLFESPSTRPVTDLLACHAVARAVYARAVYYDHALGIVSGAGKQVAFRRVNALYPDAVGIVEAVSIKEAQLAREGKAAHFLISSDPRFRRLSPTGYGGRQRELRESPAARATARSSSEV